MPLNTFSRTWANVEGWTNAERLMMARVLSAYGYQQTDACSNGVHAPTCEGAVHVVGGNILQRCACDCHLEDWQYERIHGVPKTS